MSRSLDDLSSEFQPKAFALLARLVERGISVLIVQTLRTPAEAAANLAKGTSATTHSKHLSRHDRGLAVPSRDALKCDAMDLCPYSVYALHGPDTLQWDTSDPAWRIIGEEAEKLDLRWGGNWDSPHDPGHVELIISANDRALALSERSRAAARNAHA